MSQYQPSKEASDAQPSARMSDSETDLRSEVPHSGVDAKRQQSSNLESPELNPGCDEQAQFQLSTKQAFIATRRAFEELEAQGATNFDIFNALADLFYKRGEPEISALMAEAAYRFFQK
ncbi:MAG: hypothetical protein ACFB4I_06525 [Cyanophyceae cyanobacterium]